METEREKHVLSLLSLVPDLVFTFADGISVSEMHVSVHVGVGEGAVVLASILVLESLVFVSRCRVCSEYFVFKVCFSLDLLHGA